MGKSFKLRNGLLLLSTEAPGGVYNASQLKKIAALCEGDSAIAKATEDQRIAIFAAPDKAAQIAKELRAVGLGVRHYQDGLHQPVNCIGELCGEHQQDAMGTSMDLARSLAGIVLTAAPLKIGINGCGRCCVPTHTLDISVVGEAQGYRLSLGGRNAQLPELATYIAEGIPPGELPDLLTKVVNLYKGLAQPGETLQAVLERCGSRPFLEALAPYSQDGFGADSLELGSESLSNEVDQLSTGLESPDLDSSTENTKDAEIEDFEASAGDMEIEQESPAVSYEEIPDEQLIVAPSGGQKPASGTRENMPSPLNSAKYDRETPDLAQPSPDLQSDLMDELPGFDPSLEGGDPSSGPTIDGLDLAGDGRSGVGLEPELLADEIPQEEALPRLDDHREIGDSGGLEIKDDFEHELSLPEGPIAPVEDGFDAQEALSDDFDDQSAAEIREDDPQGQDDLSLDAVAGLDPIEDIAADGRLGNMASEHPLKAPLSGDIPPEETSSLTDEFEAEKGAEVVEGSDADELEAKLAASIAAEESIVPIEDENAAARLEAMTMISGESLPSSESLESALDVPEDFSDLQIDAEPLLESDVLEAPDVDAEDFESEEFAGSLPGEENHHKAEMEIEELETPPQDMVAEPPQSRPRALASQGLKAAPLNPSMVTDEGEAASSTEAPRGRHGAEDKSSHSTPGPIPTTMPAPASKEPPRATGGAGFSLSGIDLIDGGRVALAFASGMSLVVDPRSIAPGMTKGFNFGGQRINISAADQGLNVEVDGVTIFLPVAA